MHLARIAAIAGDRGEAAAYWRKTPMLAQELGSPAATTLSLAGIAGLLSARQRFAPAVRLLAAGDGLRPAAEQSPLFGPQFQAAYGPALSATRAALSPETFARAWAGEQALSLDRAADLALAELTIPPPCGRPIRHCRRVSAG